MSILTSSMPTKLLLFSGVWMGMREYPADRMLSIIVPRNILQEDECISKVSIDALVGKLTKFNLRNLKKIQPPRVEIAFKALMALVAMQKGREKESISKYIRELESIYAKEAKQEELEALFVKRMVRGKGK